MAGHSRNGPAWFDAIPFCDLGVLKENYHITAFQHAQFPKIPLRAFPLRLAGALAAVGVEGEEVLSALLSIYTLFSPPLVFSHSRRSRPFDIEVGENGHPAWRSESAAPDPVALQARQTVRGRFAATHLLCLGPLLLGDRRRQLKQRQPSDECVNASFGGHSFTDDLRMQGYDRGLRFYFFCVCAANKWPLAVWFSLSRHGGKKKKKTAGLCAKPFRR